MARAIFQFLSLTSLVLVQLSSTAAAPASDKFVTLVDPLGLEPVPIPASVVGVDAQGRTTYAYEITATTTVEGVTATLVEHATVVAANNFFSIKDEIAGPASTLIIDGACSQQGNGAVCTVDDSGVTGVMTIPAASMGTLVLDIPSAPTGKTNSASRRASISHSGVGVVGLVGITLSLAYQLI
ncbi:hypothetical protein MSAN_01905000 [Mycena sanguinolenta]|uniref:Uncharacterized protein n=1 Tax=Mycena sanguinolenta TaxID=230812 RepID=A0A8H7CRY9_9AGAR|nr:hypothetical protein MSAN_01905000 [Mycena sanguinolenta]